MNGKLVNRKRELAVAFIFLLVMGMICLMYGFIEENKSTLVINKVADIDGIYVSIMADDINIHSCFNGSSVYLFLPSYIKAATIGIDDSVEKLVIDGVEITNRWFFDYDRTYWCQLTAGGVMTEFPLVIMKSGNMNTMFINTESGSMDYVWENKENREPGVAYVYDSKGNLINDGKLEYIKGRGNSTWEYFKRPYSIKFEEKTYLMGMDEARKWILLANSFDSTKMANKMAYDMAIQLGMESAADSEWVDLYLNGNYVGNYLVCEQLSVEQLGIQTQDLEKLTEKLNSTLELLPEVKLDKLKGIQVENNPANITGTYIIERDLSSYYEGEVSGFVTDDANYFSIKEPEYASIEQVEYISEVVQNVEDMLLSGNEDLFDYLDIESMSIQYFVDTFMGNCDMGITSLYFYKNYNDSKLYVGPVWDYDRNFGIMDYVIYDYDQEMLNYRSEEMITWLEALENNHEFWEYCRNFYVSSVRPTVIRFIDKQIDEYSAKLARSYELDNTMWTSKRNFYNSLEANTNYAKFYLVQRINMMDEKFQIEAEAVKYQGSGKIHTVTVLFEGQETQYAVEDGQLFDGLWELDETKYFWWVDDDSKIRFNEKMPILESMTISALE